MPLVKGKTKKTQTLQDRVKKLRQAMGARSSSSSANPFQRMMGDAMLAMHTHVLDAYINEANSDQSLFDFLAEMKSPIEAHRFLTGLKQNAENLVEKNLQDLGDLNYFNGLNISNSSLANFFLNSIITTVAGRSLDLGNKSAEEYLTQLPDYRIDTLKAVLNGKLSDPKQFNSEDFASDPANESAHHIQHVLQNNSRLMTLATLDLMRQEKDQAPTKLFNLMSALNMKL